MQFAGAFVLASLLVLASSFKTSAVKDHSCDRNEDYHRLLAARKSNWVSRDGEEGTEKSRVYLRQHNLWQAALDNKLVAYFFARSLGIRTPIIHACEPRGAAHLPITFPPEWGDSFVLKPVAGFNANGVLLVDAGKDRFTRRFIRGREDVLAAYKTSMEAEDAQFSTHSTTYVEELVTAAPWPGNGARSGEAPPDFKFFTFGPRIVTALVILHRKTSRECMLWVDEQFNRQDSHGCTLFNPETQRNEKSGRHKWAHCSSGIPPPPHWWDLVATARHLGAAVGVHLRVDLFDDANAGPLLGEFTPFHSNAKIQCVVVKRASPMKLDPCSLGRAWKEAGFEGSPLKRNPDPPEEIARYIEMRNWTLFRPMKRRMQNFICELALKKVAPVVPQDEINTNTTQLLEL